MASAGRPYPRYRGVATEGEAPAMLIVTTPAANLSPKPELGKSRHIPITLLITRANAIRPYVMVGGYDGP